MVDVLYLLGFIFFGVIFLPAYKYARYPGASLSVRLVLAALACVSAVGFVSCSLKYLGV